MTGTHLFLHWSQLAVSIRWLYALRTCHHDSHCRARPATKANARTCTTSTRSPAPMTATGLSQSSVQVFCPVFERYCFSVAWNNPWCLSLHADMSPHVSCSTQHSDIHSRRRQEQPQHQQPQQIYCQVQLAPARHTGCQWYPFLPSCWTFQNQKKLGWHQETVCGNRGEDSHGQSVGSENAVSQSDLCWSEVAAVESQARSLRMGMHSTASYATTDCAVHDSPILTALPPRLFFSGFCHLSN